MLKLSKLSAFFTV